jgi:hypothetical protein
MNPEQWERYRAATLQQGHEYQDFVVDLLNKHGLMIQCYSSRLRQFSIGENRQGVEIKSNLPMAKTGNLYIEYGEKAKPRKGAFAPSGIKRNDNSWLVVTGDYQEVFVFTVKDLLALNEMESYRHVRTETSIGFLLPLPDARKFAALRVLVEADGRSELFRGQATVVAALSAAMKADPRQRLLVDDLFFDPRREEYGSENGNGSVGCN